MLYIDFDGVILNTENLLFEEWRKIPNRHLLDERVKEEYIQTRDWNYILNNSEIINDSVYNLKYIDPSTSAILTKINSLYNEGSTKVKWIRDNNIKQNIILVPFQLKKTDIVDAKDNILIDDGLINLDDWYNNGGIPIFFDIDDDNIDTWNRPNTNNYQKVLSLSSFRNIK